VPVAQQPGLTSTRIIHVGTHITHTIAALPNWHPCGKAHGHSIRVAAVMNWPAPGPDAAGRIEDEAATVLDARRTAVPTGPAWAAFETATALVEREIEEARHLNSLGETSTDMADEEHLARYVHGFITARIPAPLHEGLTVYVSFRSYAGPNAWIDYRWPEAAPGEPIQFPETEPGATYRP
jgi:hypothetical protein